MNGGRCGICGDAWNDPEPRDHELGGRYSTGQIVRRYRTSHVVNVIVQLTATHRGYFEFRLCPLSSSSPQSWSDDASWKCLDSHVLDIVDTGKRYRVVDDVPMMHQLSVKLPPGLKCRHCVFQWKYNTGPLKQVYLFQSVRHLLCRVLVLNSNNRHS